MTYYIFSLSIGHWVCRAHLMQQCCDFSVTPCPQRNQFLWYYWGDLSMFNWFGTLLHFCICQYNWICNDSTLFNRKIDKRAAEIIRVYISSMFLNILWFMTCHRNMIQKVVISLKKLIRLNGSPGLSWSLRKIAHIPILSPPQSPYHPLQAYWAL